MTRPVVLQVNKFFPPWVGGVERVVENIASGLGGDFDMRVLACRYGPRVPDPPGLRIVRTPAPLFVFRMPLSIGFYPAFRRLAREADLIHLHLPFPLGEIALLLDGCAGKKIAVFYHSDIVRQKWAMPFYGPVLRSVLRRADRIAVASSGLRDRSAHLGPFRDKCVVVPYGVDLEGLTRGVEEFPLPQEDFVLFVGRLVPYKGLPYLIRAMKRVEAPLILVGKGPERKALERLAREEGLAHRVQFLGRLSEGRLRFCFSRCALFVLPSVSPNEAFGLVQLEAMVCGKPVVNTDLPSGVPEVSLHEVTGLTVPPRNPVALGEAIHRILVDRALRERLGRNGIARAREFDMHRFLDGIRGVYLDLLERR